MQNRKIQLVLFITLLVIYNVLFWKEKFGINLLLFSVLMSAMAFVLYPENKRDPKVWITAIGTFLSGIFVVIYNSGISTFAHFISFFIFLAFLQERGLRSVYYALINSITALVAVPIGFINRYVSTGKNSGRKKQMFRFIKLAVIPSFLFYVFYQIYREANPKFELLSNKVLSKIDKWLLLLTEDISVDWLIFISLGIMIVLATLIRSGYKKWVIRESAKPENLERVRKAYKPQLHFQNSFPRHFLSLKNENRSGIILLLMVNLMLLVVNIIDINWIWFGFEVPVDFNLKQFVHEGTYLLIFSILLSMAILLYLFRKNQNFFSGNRKLKILAYAWIIQNVVLSISVFLRNYHYISYHGLAYLRIGVIVFLLLTISGLITIFIKIDKVKTVYFLMKNNTWTAYTLMITLCLFNWNRIIANYNLNHWNWDDIDIDFYLELSDHELPLLYANMDKIEKQMVAHKLNRVRWVENLNHITFEKALDNRKAKYLKNYQQYGWQSWNMADANTYKALQEIKEPLGSLK